MRNVLTLTILFTASLIAAQNKPVETPQPQTNPVSQSNLPNAPSSIVTGKPHGQGQIPLEDVPHPQVKIRQLPLNIAGDTFRTFTGPIYIRTRDLYWILPMAGATAAALSQDTHVARDVISHNIDFNNTAGDVSDYVRDSLIAVPVALYGVGLFSHDERAKETGMLGGEAMTDAYIVDAIIKVSSFRERPLSNNGRGDFFQTSTGFNSSFISGHSMTSWSSAAVLAAEYPKPWPQIAIYTAASSVSINRVLAEQHFPTDVLLGSAGGWLIGHYVVRAHHHMAIFRRHATPHELRTPPTP